MRLLFYAINGVGLGHVRRLLLIADGVRKQQPEAHILFITNSAFPQMIEEKGFPCIRLPCEISPTAKSHFSTSTLSAELHDQLFLALMSHFSPSSVIFDSAWSWEQLESARLNGIKTVLILRKDTNEHMARSMKEWKRFDLICVAHSEKEFAGLGAPKRIISHLRKLGAVFAGPVVPAKQHGKQNPESPFRILVTAGGGGWPTTQRFLDSVSDGLKRVLKNHDGISAEIITGPLFKGTMSKLPGSTVHRYLQNNELLNHMRQSHLAIAQAGYNTCNDLIATGLPAILIPAEREIESQKERARYFEKTGCAHVVQNTPQAIRRAVEQLYHNRSALGKMREACSSALGKLGTPVIAERIISLVPQVTRVTLGKTMMFKDAEFVVATGKPSAVTMKQLAKLRKRAGFLLLEADLKLLDTAKSVKELQSLVDAVVIKPAEKQTRALASGKMPKELRVAIRLLRESGPYFEVCVTLTPKLTTEMAAIARQFHTLNCPQLQFHITDKIDQNSLEQPLSDLRKSVLSSKGHDMRIYCSQNPLVLSEFPKRRILSYRRRQLRTEHAALVENLREVERKSKNLEKNKTVKRWDGEQAKRDALEQELASHPQDWSSIPDELPPGLDNELVSQWRAILEERSAVEKEITENQELHLSSVEQELDALFLNQDAFKEGKATGTTWRQLELKRQRLISRHRTLWLEHLSGLDEQLRRIDARKRKLAEKLQEVMKQHKQEIKALSRSKEVKKYLSLKKQIGSMDKAIAALDKKISAVHQQLEKLG